MIDGESCTPILETIDSLRLKLYFGEIKYVSEWFSIKNADESTDKEWKVNNFSQEKNMDGFSKDTVSTELELVTFKIEYTFIFSFVFQWEICEKDL